MSERIYQDDAGGWYFHVRGNQIMGPFESFGLAEDALGKHVTACRRRVTANLKWPRGWSLARLRRTEPHSATSKA